MRSTRSPRTGFELRARGWLALILLGAISLSSSGARAAERGPSLNWVRLPGAESCIAPVELTDLVEQRLGRPVFVRARDAIVVIEGRVEPSPPLGFSVALRVTDPDGTLYGTRELTLADADCRKLDEIVALIVAVTIRHGSGGSGIALPYSVMRDLDRLFEDDSSELDPSRLPPSATAAGPPLSAASTPASPRRDVQPSEVSRSAQSARSDAQLWDVTAGLAFASGLQPEFTFAPTIAGRLAIAAVGSISISASAGLAREQTIGGGEMGRLEYRVVGGGLALCPPSWWLGSSELAACVAAAMGNVHVSGRDFQHNQISDELWLEVGPRLLGRAQVLGPAFVQLTLGAPIRVRAPAFAYTSSVGRTESAFETARIGMQVDFALGVRL
jgi:hypothetical protein